MKQYPDIPTLALMGFSLGFALMGAIWCTLGTFFEAPDDSIYSIKALKDGALLILISFAVAFIAAIYWYLVPAKFGPLSWRLNGFGFIIAIITLFSGAMVSIGIIFI